MPVVSSSPRVSPVSPSSTVHVHCQQMKPRTLRCSPRTRSEYYANASIGSRTRSAWAKASCAHVARGPCASDAASTYVASSQKRSAASITPSSTPGDTSTSSVVKRWRGGGATSALCAGEEDPVAKVLERDYDSDDSDSTVSYADCSDDDDDDDDNNNDAAGDAPPPPPARPPPPGPALGVRAAVFGWWVGLGRGRTGTV